MSQHYSRPTWSDWALLALSLLFVLMSVVIWPRKPHLALMNLVLFGGCAVVFSAIILRKLRYRRFGAARVQVSGGVPLRPKRGRLLLVAAYLLVLGVLVFSFPEAGWVFAALGLFIAGVGAFLVLAVAPGRLPAHFIQFDPDALTIGQRRWRARIAWDGISAIGESEWQSNPVLLIDVRAPDSVTIEPASATGQAAKAIAKSSMWMGAPFAIMTTQYGFDLPVLAAAVRRYVAQPAARAELRPRASLGDA